MNLGTKQSSNTNGNGIMIKNLKQRFAYSINDFQQIPCLDGIWLNRSDCLLIMEKLMRSEEIEIGLKQESLSSQRH